ncbi:guanitoxin biosynthesis heme-dependent pre-guanitoxin N-hydroxylase GntA [Flavobacterium sp. SM2513]|uniref:guanitoxin biosynthesis heme-dependent pre-guanitoxin N-hydroxylase GntA n=1 Tax=Flavobacterium sp. SM2513 TaxID=3424766 RepID=UPI003D7FCD24
MKLKNTNEVEQDFHEFIVGRSHPCVMANAIFKMKEYELKVYDDIYNEENTLSILDDLERYIARYDFESNKFETFILCFKENQFVTEKGYETALWDLLQRLHDKDDVEWDANVSNNPEDENFSFSLKGKAFFVIGMHPESSRIARQAPYCTVVFNLHWQFEKLREMGAYTKVRDRIRKRDKALQGTINPVLKDFGDDSETRQYSGRKVEAHWKCPFAHK